MQSTPSNWRRYCFIHADVEKKSQSKGRPRKYFTLEERRAAHVISQTQYINRRKPPPYSHTQGTGEQEWHTPDVYLHAVRQILGTIGLDPASSDEAQQTVQASRYFTAQDNALLQAWSGRVFLNPPYTQPLIEHFVIRLVNEVRAGHVSEAILLTHNCTNTKWFHAAASGAAVLCLTRDRIIFIDTKGQQVAPTQVLVFFYFGSCVEPFADVFRPFGIIR